MTFLQAGTPAAFGSVTSFPLTVPAGVTPDQVVLIAVAGTVATNGADVTAASTGATFTTIAGGAAVFDNTVWVGLIKGTGLTAGNTITVTLSAARQVAGAHYYFDNDFGTPSAFNARVDSATNVAPDIAVTLDSDVYVVSLERSSTTGTTVTGIVNSNGNTVTPLAFNESATPTFCSFSLTQFHGDPTDDDSGTTTLTYGNTSTSGMALTISELIDEIDLDADFAGDGSLTAATEAVHDADADFSGSGELTVAAEAIHEADADFSGSGTLTATAEATHDVDAPFSGSGELTAITEANGIVEVGASFAGSGTFSALVEPSGDVEALFTGGGDFAPLVEPSGEVEALFDGPGSLTAIVSAAPEVLALFGGEGDLAAAVEQEGVDAAFSGTGTLTAIVSVVDPCEWPIPTPECCSEWDDAEQAQRDRALQLATEFLWAETGRQFGLCVQAVLPCGLACPCTGGNGCHLSSERGVYDGGYGWSFQPVLLADGQVANTSCSDCSCCSPCEIALPGSVESITSVTVDGEAVAPEAYVVYDHKFLARLDGQCWPDCQDFGASPTFVVTYNEGIPVPYAGLQAASDLACALLRTCPDLVDCGSCMTDAVEASSIVSTWIKSVNPNGLVQGARLLIPGVRGTEESHRHVTWSG